VISKKNLTEDKENILLPSLIYSAITPTSRHQDSPQKKRTKEKLLEALPSSAKCIWIGQLLVVV
jgi:hypothetical protein